MKCKKVKNLLPEFIDGKCNTGLRNEIEEHLSQCGGCRDELEFLKSFQKEASSLAKVTAPDDFLEQLHSRLEMPPRRTGIIEKLFYPLKLKIPLEAAGVLAMAILVVIIFNPFNISTLEYNREQGIVTQDYNGSDRETDDANLEYLHQDPAAPISIEEKKSTLARKTRDNTRPVVGNGHESAEEETPQDKAAELYAEKNDKSSADKMIVFLRVSTKEKQADIVSDSSGQRAKKEYRREASAIHGTTFGGKKSVDIKDTDELLTADPGGSRLSRIIEITRSVDGRLIKHEREASQARENILIEIPAQNYDNFIKILSNEWNIETGSPRTDIESSGNLKINVEIDASVTAK